MKPMRANAEPFESAITTLPAVDKGNKHAI
jgi:hypothetical protein